MGWAILAKQVRNRPSKSKAPIIQTLDKANTLKQAEYLVREYKEAYGHDWEIWHVPI